jgi:hypothetical protein
MAESVRCVLEVYAAATFSLSTPIHTKGGVVGDEITYVVTPAAVGGFTGTVEIAATGIPAGGSVSYSPTGPQAMGTAVTVTIDTGTGPAGTYDIIISEA